MANIIRIGIIVLLVFFKIGEESNLQAQELIMFERGFSPEFYEDDRKINRKEFLSKINSLPESAQLWKQYKKNSAIGIIGSLGSLGGFVWWLSKEDNESTTAPIITTLGATFLGSIFTNKAFKNRRDAILSYNKDATVGSYISPSNNGIGLTLHF